MSENQQNKTTALKLKPKGFNLTVLTELLLPLIAAAFVTTEAIQRGVVLHSTYYLALTFCLLQIIIAIGNKFTVTNCNNVIEKYSARTWLLKTTYFCRLCLISSLSITLLGHSPNLNTLINLLIPLSVLTIVEYRQSLKLLKQSKAIALYLLYCLWISITIWTSNVPSPHQINFYLMIGAYSFILAVLIAKDDHCKQIMGYTLAIATIITTYQRGIDLSLAPNLEPDSLLMTYKNLAAFTGIIGLSILICLKPKNTFSIVNMLIISITTVAIYLTPSQAGKIALLVLIAYTLWLYCYRLLKDNKRLSRLMLTTSLILTITLAAGILIYHKDISLSLGRKETLGGRTTIWEVTGDWIQLSPVFGNGGAFWYNQGGSAASNHHHEYVNRGYNGFLDTLVQSGLVGLLLLTIFMVTLVNQTKLRWGERITLIMVACLSLLSETHSFTGTFLIYGGATTRAILIFWFAYCLSQCQHNRPKNTLPNTTS